jgi:hypothetical protein
MDLSKYFPVKVDLLNFSLEDVHAASPQPSGLGIAEGNAGLISKIWG